MLVSGKNLPLLIKLFHQAPWRSWWKRRVSTQSNPEADDVGGQQGGVLCANAEFGLAGALGPEVQLGGRALFPGRRAEPGAGGSCCLHCLSWEVPVACCSEGGGLGCCCIPCTVTWELGRWAPVSLSATCILRMEKARLGQAGPEMSTCDSPGCSGPLANSLR